MIAKYEREPNGANRPAEADGDVTISEICGIAPPDQWNTTLSQFHTAVDEYPENIALVCTHQEPTLYGIESTPQLSSDFNQRPYLRWTYKSFKEGIDRLKAGLIALGVRPGMPLVTILDNSAEFALTWWAAMDIGAIIAPIDSRRLTNSSEFSHMIRTVIDASDGGASLTVVTSKADYFDHAAIKPIHISIKIAVENSHKANDGHILSFAEVIKSTPAPTLYTSAQLDMTSNSTEQVQDAYITFTSGSTALPKGVLRRHPEQARLTYRNFSTPGYETLPGDLWCVVTPNNHTVGILSLVAPLLLGAGAIYAGPYFTGEETAKALLLEQSTHAIFVPSMVDSIADCMDKRSTTLKAVMLAGSTPTLDHLQTIIDVFGARGVCNQYGSTEGVVCCTAVTSNPRELLGNQDQIESGQPAPDAKVKICLPSEEGGSRSSLPADTSGEIHFSGALSAPSVYIGHSDIDEVSYVDKSGYRWFITGDHGLIDRSGRLFVLGRHKDMIIRGGENISPASIEYHLAQNPRLASTSIQIVGQSDPICGEVPVAIVHGNSDIQNIAAEIHSTVLREMGPMWNPQDVIKLKDLGLHEWPQTVTGKIKKAVLRKLLRDKMPSAGIDSQAEQHQCREPKEVYAQIVKIWASCIGLSERHIPLQSRISDLADSLTIAQVRGRLKREITGLQMLTIRDISDADTLSDSMSKIVHRLDAGTQQGCSSPDTVINMVHALNDPGRFESTRRLVVDTISPHGFTWDNVASVFPAQNTMAENAKKGMTDTLKHQAAYVTRGPSTPQKVRGAIEAMLRVNPILPSFLVWERHDTSQRDIEAAFHVTLKPDRTLFEHVIQDAGSIDLESLEHLATSHPHPEWARCPGILFRALIYEIENSDLVGFVINVSHGVMDATYNESFHTDLDRALNGGSSCPLRPHMDYQLWSESYYSFRYSPQARAAVTWHAQYLQGLQKHWPKCQWPSTRKVMYDPSGKIFGNHDQHVLHTFRVPGLAHLRQSHPHISNAIIVKAAQAVFNTQQTCHDHAIFSNMQGGRNAWPFLPASYTTFPGTIFDEATDVAGPLMQIATNLVHIRSDETVLALLNRLQRDQNEMTKHAHAPWPHIEDALDAHVGCHETSPHRGLIYDVTTFQMFNWVPGLGRDTTRSCEPFEHFKALRRVTEPRVGFVVNAGLGGVANECFVLHIDGDGLDKEQKCQASRSLELLIRSIIDSENWQREIGVCMPKVDSI